ncbi:MAG: acetylesterase [Clostridiales bacterium]|nr:acetylesterase [Clostridiales bacterium]
MAILQMEYFSHAMRGFRSFTAVLPLDPPPSEEKAKAEPGYEAGPWPTLYLLHGLSGSRNDWLKNSDIEMLAARYGLAVIMPDGDNRFYLDNPETGVFCGEMTGRELVTVTRNMFRLSPRREDTLIGGLSMGGYGAVRNGLKYRDTFGTILAFSSALITNQYARGELDNPDRVIMPFGYYTYTFGPKEKVQGSETDPAFLAKRAMEDGNRPELFLACGSEDFLYENNLEFHNALEEMKYPHEWWVEPGVHNFDFWRRAVTAGLAWWASRREGEGK